MDANFIAKNCASVALRARELHEYLKRKNPLRILVVCPPKVHLNQLSQDLGYDESSVKISCDFPDAYQQMCATFDFDYVNLNLDMSGSLDGVHLTPENVSLVAERIWPALEGLLPRFTNISYNNLLVKGEEEEMKKETKKQEEDESTEEEDEEPEKKTKRVRSNVRKRVRFVWTERVCVCVSSVIAHSNKTTRRDRAPSVRRVSVVLEPIFKKLKSNKTSSRLIAQIDGCISSIRQFEEQREHKQAGRVAFEMRNTLLTSSPSLQADFDRRLQLHPYVRECY